MNIKYSSKIYDAVGIGIGAFNLSLAALLTKVSDFRYVFFDQKREFNWHQGMLLENSQLQIHFLKDLASCVDPTNPYTFLAYLTNKNRIYQFLNRKRNTVSRHEFNDYFQWAATYIPHLHFNERVIDIEYDSKKFRVSTENQSVLAKNLIIGTGPEPYIPKLFVNFLGNTFFHNMQFREYSQHLDFTDKRVAIIGGGQSGAEIFDRLISQESQPASIIWASKRLNFQALEDSCFINEFYTPHYVNYFYNLSNEVRKNKLEQQRLTSDGISQEFSDKIYNKLYEIKYLNKRRLTFELIPNHTLCNVKKHLDHYQIELWNQDLEKAIYYEVDIIVLATGYRVTLPECLKSLFPNVQDVSLLPINFDYSIHWQHAATNKIFIQNGAKHTHGIADPNLSLAAWRNAMIINSLLAEPIYPINVDETLLGRAWSM